MAGSAGAPEASEKYAGGASVAAGAAPHAASTIIAVMAINVNSAVRDFMVSSVKMDLFQR